MIDRCVNIGLTFGPFPGTESKGRFSPIGPFELAPPTGRSYRTKSTFRTSALLGSSNTTDTFTCYFSIREIQTAVWPFQGPLFEFRLWGDTILSPKWPSGGPKMGKHPPRIGGTAIWVRDSLRSLINHHHHHQLQISGG